MAGTYEWEEFLESQTNFLGLEALLIQLWILFAAGLKRLFVFAFVRLDWC